MYTDTSNLEKTNYINLEILKRNIPSHPLQPYLSVAPISTKYQVLPLFNLRKESSFSVEQKPTFNPNITFNPGTRKAPNWATYVNVESELRNQVYAISKGSENLYVPSSNSDLYYYNFETKPTTYNPHNSLFLKETFNDFNPNPNNLGYELFGNCTRQQLKETNKKFN
jgi:hypothetical protein